MHYHRHPDSQLSALGWDFFHFFVNWKTVCWLSYTHTLPLLRPEEQVWCGSYQITRKMTPLARIHLLAKRKKTALGASGETQSFIYMGIVRLIWELGFCAFGVGFLGSQGDYDTWPHLQIVNYVLPPRDFLLCWWQPASNPAGNIYQSASATTCLIENCPLSVALLYWVYPFP